MEFEIIETERLLLRKSGIEQLNFVFNNYSDEELSTFLGAYTDTELATDKERFKQGFTSYNRSVVIFHLLDKTDNKVIGACAFHNWYAIHQRTEIGYDMKLDEYKQKGYMTEAVKAIIHYGFTKMNLNRIEALVSPKNIPSFKLIANMGFSQEGVLKEHYNVDGVLEDSFLFALLKSEYFKINS
jgi:ribosomal-protein-alanine N-acetyltransferase